MRKAKQMLTTPNPFHAGELEAQARVGLTEMAQMAGSAFKPALTERHQMFFSQLPFLVLACADLSGNHWVTLLDGPEGFLATPNGKTLLSSAQLHPDDPLYAAYVAENDVGILGIDLSKRHRVRLSGRLQHEGVGMRMNVGQTFGNCPQYIHKRQWRRVSDHQVQASTHSDSLSTDQMRFVQNADTLFMGTGQLGDRNSEANGFDASHKGGERDFVTVVDGTHLRIPDYAGNNYFNSVGNLLRNPAIGLLFVDFRTGKLLHITGHAKVNWTTDATDDPAALRSIDVTITAVLERSSALAMRWDDAIPSQETR